MKTVFVRFLNAGCCAVWVWFGAGVSVALGGEFDRAGRLWEPVLEWTLENPTWTGNPFDVEGIVTFVHGESGEERTTPLFYDGETTWRFRFTGTKTGSWTFRTTSPDPDLGGREGTVEIESNPNPKARGFIVASGNKFAKQAGANGKLEAFVPNVYMNLRDYGNPEQCGWTRVSPTFSDSEVFNAYLDEAEVHGANAAFALIANQWFKAGVASSREHESVNPDPETFRALETAIQQAQERGMHLHIWAWGDQARRWSPVGVGGVNGEADRRLQRYIAARLGPLPGWTMSYGFDLSEWVTEAQVEEWANSINEQSGWKRLLAARSDGGFSEVKALPVAAYDDRLENNFYERARTRLNERPNRPVIFERRFTYLRDGVWDMETTRRAFWQFTLAGGAGSIWGHYPPDCTAHQEGGYPAPEQLRTHRRFWAQRFLLEMEPAPDLSNEANTLVLQAANEYMVFYREETEEIHMNLSEMNGPQPVIAVDTKRAYSEIDIGILDPAEYHWEAPYPSDWAIGVGK